MALELSSDMITCFRCGKQFPKWRGNFYASNAELYRGVGYLPCCKNCVEDIYDSYLKYCHNTHDAARQTCRKLNLVWVESTFKTIEKGANPKSMMSQYLARINIPNNTGRSYDEILLKEGTLWDFGKRKPAYADPAPISQEPDQTTLSEGDGRPDVSLSDIPDEVIAFWGSGYQPSMYLELEQRRSYWMSRFESGDELDIGTEALIRQICSLELDINRDRAAGRAVDKSVIALNTLLGSANLKPVQKKQDDADASLSSTPMGVWLYRFENERPLPDIDDKLKENKYRKYVFTWMGHLCRMLGLKNAYTKLYEDEIERLRVEKPEYSGDDDETFMMDVMEEVDDDIPFSDPGEDDES